MEQARGVEPLTYGLQNSAVPFRLTGYGTDVSGRIQAHFAPSCVPLRSVPSTCFAGGPSIADFTAPVSANASDIRFRSLARGVHHRSVMSVRAGNSSSHLPHLFAAVHDRSSELESKLGWRLAEFVSGNL
jgi:hypothetical protein